MLVTVEDAARQLHVTQECVRRWLRSGRLAGERAAGREWRIRLSVIREFNATQTRRKTWRTQNEKR